MRTSSLKKINDLLIEKINEQKLIIDKFMVKLFQDEKSYSMTDCIEHLGKNLRAIKNKFNKCSGYYCKMSYNMFLQIVDHLSSFGVEPEYMVGPNADYAIGGFITYSNGLMFTCTSLEQADEYLLKYFGIVFHHYYNQIYSDNLQIDYLSFDQLLRAIKTTVHFDTKDEDFKIRQKLVEKFIWKTGEKPEYHTKYFDNGVLIEEDQEIKNGFISCGYEGKMSDEKLCIRYKKINIEECIKIGNWNLIMYACEENICYQAKFFEEIAVYGSVDFLRRTQDKKWRCTVDICMISAQNNQLEFLICAHELGYTWNCDTIYYSLCNGNFECMKYAIENGCEDDMAKFGSKWQSYEKSILPIRKNIGVPDKILEEKCNVKCILSYLAAVNGDLKCLRYLHEKGYAWDKTTCLIAVYRNNFECFEYARKNGCDWDEKRCEHYINLYNACNEQ